MRWYLSISQVVAVVLTYVMHKHKFWITWNLLFALTFRRRVRFLSIVRAWNVSERGPRFCTGNCDASRRDDDTTMSSTSHASTRKTVSGQDVRRPYPNRNSIAKREGRRNIEWKGNEGKIRENERKRCVSTSSVVRRAGFFYYAWRNDDVYSHVYAIGTSVFAGSRERRVK